jgi:hypothetical protein
VVSQRICNTEQTPGGWRCYRVPGHAGAHAYGTTNAGDGPKRCGELSPDGQPCMIFAFSHNESYGPEHSWERCTSRLVSGMAKTRCILEPGHELMHMGPTWTNHGEHEGLSI